MRSVRHLGVAVCAGALALAAAAPAAQAGCGGVQRAQPTHKLGDFRAPLIVGDSVLLGAIPEVAKLGFEINTRGCRQWSEGDHILWARRHAHTLPHEVAMFLGADWTVSMRQIRYALHIVGQDRVLVLVTPREVGGVDGSDAAHMREAARQHPGRILLLDWVRHTRDHPSWFAPDGLHLGYGGAAALARFLRLALPYAAPGAFPPGGPSGTQAPQERAASA